MNKTMLKDKLHLVVIIIGLISFGLGINTLLQTPTVILPPWFLILLYTPIIIGISFLLGFITKKLMRTRWKTLTVSTIYIATISLTFFISQYRKTLTINIPDNFTGSVYLILSDESTNDFKLNEFGIGYINEDTYSNGFKPEIYQRGEEVTKKIKGYSSGSASYKNGLSIKYLSFDTPGKISAKDKVDFHTLLELYAIDTNRIKVK